MNTQAFNLDDQTVKLPGKISAAFCIVNTRSLREQIFTNLLNVKKAQTCGMYNITKIIHCSLASVGLAPLKSFSVPLLNSKTHTHTHIHTHIHTYAHTYTHPHIYMHTMCTQWCMWRKQNKTAKTEMCWKVSHSHLWVEVRTFGLGVIRVICTYSICHKLFCQANQYHHQGY